LGSRTDGQMLGSRTDGQMLGSRTDGLPARLPGLLHPMMMNLDERSLSKLLNPNVLDRANDAVNGYRISNGNGAMANGAADTSRSLEYIPGTTNRLLEVHEIVGFQQDPPMYRISGAFASAGEMRKEVCWLPADEVHVALKDSAFSRGALPLMEMMERFAPRSTDDMHTRVRALGMLT